MEPLPRTGRHLVELVYEHADHNEGNLGSRYWTGVIGANNDAGTDWVAPHEFDGFWGFEDFGWFEDDDDENNDGIGVRHGRSALAAPQESMNSNGRLFEESDRLGLLVDMDEREMEVLRNGETIPGLVFTGLPEEVWVVAAPYNEGATVRFLDENEPVKQPDQQPAAPLGLGAAQEF